MEWIVVGKVGMRVIERWIGSSGRSWLRRRKLGLRMKGRSGRGMGGYMEGKILGLVRVMMMVLMMMRIGVDGI